MATARYGAVASSSEPDSLAAGPPRAETGVVAALKFVRAVSWMWWGGFGAPWVLFAVVAVVVRRAYPPAEADAILSSDGYFYASVLGSVGIACGRTAVILKITYDREAAQRAAHTASQTQLLLEPISHRHYWWCNRAGLLASSVFVLGDGLGRIFVPATAFDFVAAATWAPGGLYATSAAYFYTIATLTMLSGMYRVVWWVWYWVVFSELDERVRARVNDTYAEDVVEDGLPSGSSTHLAAPVNNDDDRDDGKDAGRSSAAAEPHPFKVFVSSIYPRVSRMVPRTVRHAVKRMYAFLGGFGCTWAIFSVISACVNEATGTAPLATTDWYLWSAVALCIVGGLYGGDKRFKVFLH
jgi:hypothetical protein